MTRRQVRDAYRKITLSSREKEDVLNRILSNSLVMTSDGKEHKMYKKKYKPILITAMIALMVLLMGCAWVVMNLEDLIIGQFTSQHTYTDEESGEVITEPTVIRDVISMQGYAGSPNYLASKEWYEFEQSYDPDGSILLSEVESGYDAPKEYDAYMIYSQEMQDKVDEICTKYGLQPAGQGLDCNTWQVDAMMGSLGIDALTKMDVEDLEYYGGYFYACGNFKMEWHFTMSSEECAWKDTVHVSTWYSDKAYLDRLHFTIDPQETEEWNYTCSDGTELLIVNSNDTAHIFCDREDAFLNFKFYSRDIMDENGQVMTNRDIEQIAEVFDYSIKPQQPDMDAALHRLVEATAAYNETKPPREPFSYAKMLEWMIPWRIETFVDPPQLYYAMLDFDDDGVVDMLMGYEDEFTNMWTLDYLGDALPADLVVSECWDELSALWLTLEKTPIEDFPFDEY